MANLSDHLTTGTVSLTGSGSLAMTTTVGQTADLSGVTNSLTGTLTISDNTGDEAIAGTSGNDIINLTSGIDVVNANGGTDTINVSISNLTSADNINGAAGTDSINLSSTGTLNYGDLAGVTNVENLNFFSGNDTFQFTDETSFSSTMSKFSAINMGSGTDTVAFSSTVNADLDFSKLSSLEKLSLSSGADTLNISGDEPTSIYGNDGDDQFTLNFSTVRTLDGGNNTDTVKFTGATSTISADTDFTFGASLTNMEKLDISGLSLNTSNNNTEFNFTEAMLDAWTGSTTGNLTLSFTSSQVEKIKFTDSSSTVHDSAATIVDNTTYTIGNNHLTIDITDV